MLKNIYTIVLIFILINVSCSNEANNCNINSVSSRFDFNNSIECGKDFDLFIGEEGFVYDWSNKRSVIYMKKNGTSNEKWYKLDIALQGNNKSIAYSPSYVYFSNYVFAENKSDKKIKYKLFKLNKINKKLQEIYSSKELSFRKLFFKDDLNGYAVVSLSNLARDNGLMTTSTGGITWDTLKIDRVMGKLYKFENKLYFISVTDYINPNIVFSMDLDSKQIDSTLFDFDIKDIQIYQENNYLLLGEENYQISLGKYENDKYETIYVFTSDSLYFPKKLYKYNDFIAVLLGKRDYGMFGGLGGTTDELHLSFDNGKTWEIDDTFDDALYIEPLSFYKDERMVAYIGHGKIVTCDLKNR